MIQLVRDDADTLIRWAYLDLYDKMTNSDYKVLMTLTSQLTGKSKTFLPGTNYANKDRYLYLLILVAATLGAENLLTGTIFLGSTDFPLGFYDVTIYQNTSNTNLDPTGLTVIYTGLANLAPTSDAEPVEYSEYTTNDSDTESVYITF
mgnify:CR=1 FL=1|tara:strand:- start:870 stop:1313 length:444 start_codon:yes stop_codon:yes gene_type:complete